MQTVLVVLTVIVSILLILVVLIQKSKGGGLASNFAGSNQLMGVRRTNDFIEKTTWTLAIIILFLSIFSSFFGVRVERRVLENNHQTQDPTYGIGNNEKDDINVPPTADDVVLPGADSVEPVTDKPDAPAAPAADETAAPAAPAADGSVAPAAPATDGSVAPAAPATDGPAAEGQE